MELVLKQVRERHGYTQQQVADLLGVKVATYRTWEQGTVKLTLENAFKVSEVIGCTPNDLCNWYETHPRPAAADADPAHEELARCYDACTPERRDRMLQDAREKAFMSREFSEPAVVADDRGQAAG